MGHKHFQGPCSPEGSHKPEAKPQGSLTASQTIGFRLRLQSYPGESNVVPPFGLLTSGLDDYQNDGSILLIYSYGIIHLK